MTVNSKIRKAFNNQAQNYVKAAVMQREIGSRLLERLQYFTLQPKRILDLGCGGGELSQRLVALYPNALVVSLDLAENMLHYAKHDNNMTNLVQSDMAQLPFAAATFDLIFTNQVIHWAQSLPALFNELNRVLTLHGCIMFTTLGPDTFCELGNAFASVDNYAHVNTFLDMHDVGDLLLQAGFLDPVVDMERLVAHYSTVNALLRSLQLQGVKNIHPQKSNGLMGKHAWQQFCDKMQSMATKENKIPLTYEVIYGHAWKNVVQKKLGGKTFISIDDMKALLL